MKFRAHDTFFIRKGWLSKGMRNVLANNDVFISRENNPMDVLGIGANMVKALRYWLVAVGLTTEPSSGRRLQTPTVLGRIIYENDPYFEEMGTLWLLHYQLVKDNVEATSWYYFFNEFSMSEFSRDDFVAQINKYLRNSDEGEKPIRTLEDDFNCIINTYVPRIKSNPEKVHPESNIDCPLGELGLIDISNKKAKIYKKSAPKKDTLHPLILLAVIIDQAKSEKSIRISSIQNDFGNAGKVFNLDIISLIALLYKIEKLGHIKVVRTAGLDVVRIETEWTFEDCVEEYYRVING
ncbi:MAG: DUF4007 family protein [Clostridiaceae bacterium]|jgi:hypothetical protein|nr:DUF4007 family protein [Clostridiaceae bacterium]